MPQISAQLTVNGEAPSSFLSGPKQAAEGSNFLWIECGDCLHLMSFMEDASVDCVMSDLPYGTTYAPWDCALPLDKLWGEWKRIVKPGGAIVLTASQPFTAALVMSNPKWFRCEWIWDKVNAANFANAKKQPMKVHESVLVFCDRAPYYDPQKVPGAKNHVQGKSKVNASETRLINGRVGDDLSGMKYPRSIQVFPKHSSQCGLHPTQKPIELMSYLVRTYTKPGDVVLDPCCGSGSTLVAAQAEGRGCIGFDVRQDYCETARKRCAAGSGKSLTAPACQNHSGAVAPSRHSENELPLT